MNRYLYYSLIKGFEFLSPVYRSFWKKKIRNFGSLPLKYQPSFIVGTPRCGSTILYQILSNALDVLYIDNIVCLFYKNLSLGFWLSEKLFKGKSHNCFKSIHGSTVEFSLHGPSECWHFWYRWLPADRDFVDFTDFDNSIVKEIKEEISAVINCYNKPLLFKNLNMGQRLRLISRVFPNARIIFLKREPIYVAQSILQAKRQIGIKDNEFWSVKPPNVKILKNLNPYEQIVKQIYYIEKQIIQDSRLFKKDNFLVVHYRELCKAPTRILQQCQRLILAKLREDYKIPSLRITTDYILPAREINALKEEISKLDWENYSD